ncbi:MAG: hypothetical protein ACR2RE_03010 [Geminicoccaceae bacterium]
MHNVVKIFLLFSCLSVSGCADLLDEGEDRPKLTPLEVQSLQKRDLETNKDIAFASVVSVFQDLGYTIVSADKETGFITAESLADSSEDSDTLDIILDILADEDEEYDVTTEQTKATAFVEEFAKDRTGVRLSFVTSKNRSGIDGQASKKDKQILDAEIYRNAFERIENAIFVRTDGAS